MPVQAVRESAPRQPFEVLVQGEPDEVSYDMHTGGNGAEIGSYTSIECGACHTVIWREEVNLPDAAGHATMPPPAVPPETPPPR